MSVYFEKLKNYLTELDLSISTEDPNEEIVVVNDPEEGIQNLVLDCEDPILVMEQLILEVSDPKPRFYERLLQMNRTLVHGAFVLDDDSRYVIFRDTLQLENLDLNELQASIQSLSLALAENGGELLGYARS